MNFFNKSLGELFDNHVLMILTCFLLMQILRSFEVLVVSNLGKHCSPTALLNARVTSL